MKIYNYDPNTKEYTGESDADPNPLVQGEYLIPFNSTLIIPPSAKEGYVRVFIENTWQYSAIIGNSVSPTPVITNEMVDAERDKRIYLGKTFKVDTLYITLRGTDKDISFLTSLKQRAIELKAENITDDVMIYRDATNKIFTLTPDQFINLVNAGIDWVQEVFVVSWSMKDHTGDHVAGIPEDYTSDLYWPT